ncbi:hypothetical protein [Solimonas terrae]|uniref:Lipoprotein n=1 Tax=Solimonas terrae TaxID=1396819 RepID=A0A6M2BRT5_9GAMM|nr:hypothetical protein [Solimonas terrae]NGY04697.1 hypothetical protein [Solimonas terrae]
MSIAAVANASMNRLRVFLSAFTLILLSACATDGVVHPAPCKDSCTTHSEGYQWAMDAALVDPSPCDNKAYGPDFVRGCKDAVNDFSQLQPASKGL